jgi:HEAT repeat protein
VNQDPAESLAAIDAVVARAAVDAAALRSLGECLASRHKVVQRRAAEAFVALHARGIAVRDQILMLLHSETLPQRWGAAYALSLLGPPPASVVPILLECLGAGDGDVRWAAADILLRLRDRVPLVEPLCGLVRSGNAGQRKMAAYCLRDLDQTSAAAESLMLAALQDIDPGVRMAAMSYLVGAASDRAAAAHRIVDLLNDPDAGVRRAAAAILGRLGQRSATVHAALRAAAVSGDPSLQRAAERSLRQLSS